MTDYQNNTGKTLLETLLNDSVLDDIEKTDCGKSLVLKKAPSSLEELRKADPQGAIDYLHSRKEAYKRTCLSLNKRLIRMKRERDRYHSKFKEELEMKNWWKYACITVGTGAAAVLIISMILIQVTTAFKSQIPNRIPTSAIKQKSPTSMLASVNILDGSKQGSGTIIAQGPEKSLVLSAAHNFQTSVGGNFWVYFADGSYTTAKLLAIDHKRDLAAAEVDTDAVLGRAYIPTEVPDGEASGVGYTNGEGPNYKTLKYRQAFWDKRCVWEFAVTSGTFWSGDSGGGVFINDGLIGVTTSRDCNGNFLYSCSIREIKEFLKENESKISNCGNYMDAPSIQVSASNTPPLWSPKPNIPLFIENKLEKRISDLKEEIDQIKFKPVEKSESLLKRPSEV